MKCENMIGKAFGNISQRLIYSYLCSYPEFEPIPSAVSRESQKQMYDFLWEFVSGIYSDPQKLGLPVDEDDWLGDRQLNKARPQLIKSQQKIVKAVKEFDVNPKNWTDPLASIIILLTTRTGGYHVKQKT